MQWSWQFALCSLSWAADFQQSTANTTPQAAPLSVQAYLATTLHQGDIHIHHLVLPDQDPDAEVDQSQGGNDGLDDTVDQPNQHDDGVICHLHQ